MAGQPLRPRLADRSLESDRTTPPVKTTDCQTRPPSAITHAERY